MTRIAGERLYIKEIEIEELTDPVMAWFSDSELMKYYTNSRRVITKDTLVASIERGKRDGDTFTYGIYDIERELLIGTLKLGPINKIHKTSDLATLIGDRSFLGKGLAPEAIRLGVELAFSVYDLRKLYGGMYASNVASIKAYCRAGWLIEGRLKGFYQVEGRNEDRVLVGCFNPKYFSEPEIEDVRRKQGEYYE
ncbi:GNAT family N-acetyltransferase [Butyricimonas synergistica]|uniref:GNAT family N-acetyltransferase n=1 Tax=Butyricimonas synergistica TaxID=544644 RepID=UPI0003786750|nr:GNAT family protein [Butyricimonas synergistica]